MEFLYKLKLKNCPDSFVKGGILVSQIARFDVSEEDLTKSMFIKALTDTEAEFIKEYIEVVITRKETP